MAVDSVVLEQLVPSAATESDVYTVPTGRRASVRIYVATVTAAAIDVKIRKAGEASAAKQCLACSTSVLLNSSNQYPEVGTILLSAGDVVTVESDQADTAFTVNGYEDDIPTE